MTKTKSIYLALLAVLLSPMAANAVPIFINGDFEAGVSTGWDSMNAVNTPGWTITTGTSGFFPGLNLNQVCGGPFGNNNQGCQFATLGAPRDEPGGGSSIAQTISGFTIGNSYTLDWLQSSEFTDEDWVTATIIGAGVLSQDFLSNPFPGPGPGQFWQGWQTMIYSFVADATTLTFQFNASTNRGFFSEPGVDDFNITAQAAQVPEPGTLALFALGLLGLGLTRKRAA